MKSPDEYFEKLDKWRDELTVLRKLISKTELIEQIKWGIPVYTIENKNVIGISGFKNHFGIWFYQGVFLKDPKGILVNAQEGKTKAMRHWRMTSIKDIDQESISQYVNEAIENQKAGKEVKHEKKELVVPVELESLLESREGLRASFESLTPGKQKEFANHVSEAKMEKTRVSRAEKVVPLIEAGVGLNDKYKK